MATYNCNPSTGRLGQGNHKLKDRQGYIGKRKENGDIGAEERRIGREGNSMSTSGSRELGW